MIERISSPKVGDGLRASWGASVASAINRLAEPALKEEMLPNQRNRRGGAAASPLAPWQFSPDSGWSNGIVQVGLEFHSTDQKSGVSASEILNCNVTADGTHYLKILAGNNQVSVVVDPPVDDIDNGLVNDTVYLKLADIQDGAVVTHYLPMNPVIPIRL